MKPGFFDGILSKEYQTIKSWSETGNDIDIGREVEHKTEVEKFRLRDGIITLEENINLCMTIYKLYNFVRYMESNIILYPYPNNLPNNYG